MDWNLLVMKVLSCFVREPDFPTVPIGVSLSSFESEFGKAIPSEEPSFLLGCRRMNWSRKELRYELAVETNCVRGVIYDIALYRESGPRIYRKLRYLLSAYSTSAKLRFLVDTQDGALIYRTTDDQLSAIFAYGVDQFIVRETAFKLNRDRI